MTWRFGWRCHLRFRTPLRALRPSRFTFGDRRGRVGQRSRNGQVAQIAPSNVTLSPPSFKAFRAIGAWPAGHCLIRGVASLPVPMGSLNVKSASVSGWMPSASFALESPPLLAFAAVGCASPGTGATSSTPASAHIFALASLP